MCGIAGYISLNNSITPAELVKATSVLQHRGPDAEGFYFSENKKVGLGHRRLSILDVSSSANQPMFSADGRYVIVYNGEVYNYKELQQQLKNKGANLKTTSDTEVILELFAEQGANCFAALNGMFALAIYDLQKNMLVLSRDHAGIKPLFVYQGENEIIFSSELKSIRSIVGNGLSINKEAIPYFLHLGFIPHPLTIYNNVQKFPAAHFLQIDASAELFRNISGNTFPFWNVAGAIGKETLSEEKTANKLLKNLLSDSVEKQLMSDVPIGTFLSGGVDSSLVTAIAAKVSPGKINTFSIAIDGEKYNESKYAMHVAKHLQTNHHEFVKKKGRSIRKCLSA